MSQDTTFGFDECLKIAAACGLGFVDAQNFYNAISSVGGGVEGSGTTDALPVFTASGTIGDSVLLQDADSNLQTNKRLHVIVDLNDAGEDPALKVTTNGTNIGAPVAHALDGGVQSFHTGSYNTTSGQRQSFAGLFDNDSTVASGSNGLIATGVKARATGGTENYCFYGTDGTARFDEDCTIGTALTVGSGAAAASGETKFYTKLIVADNTKQVTLGNNVDNFMIPGSSSTSPCIGIGASTTGAALDANGTWCAKALQVGAPSGMTGAKWTSGTGSPEGAVTGNKGDLFSRTDGGAATCLYVKESTGGNTGWKAVTTS